MPDIGVLLREAVPPDPTDPDLDAVIRRVTQRRQRRRLVRATVSGALATLIVVGLVAVVGGRTDGDQVSTDVTTAETTVPGPQPDAAAFVQLMAERGALATTDFARWPLTPEDFVGGSARGSGGVLVGTLQETWPGSLDPWPCFADQGTDTCLDLVHLETVVQADRLLPGGTPPREPVGVPWVVETVGGGASAEEAVERSRLATAPFQEVAPIGARVIVFLAPSRDTSESPTLPTPWSPVEPSGIVVEGADGQALVPHPDPAQSQRPETFDEYLSQVEALLGV